MSDPWRYACINCRDNTGKRTRDLDGSRWDGWYCHNCNQAYQVAFDLKNNQPVAANTESVK